MTSPGAIPQEALVGKFDELIQGLTEALADYCWNKVTLGEAESFRLYSERQAELYKAAE